MLTLHDITVTAGSARLLDGVSATVRTGQLTAIVGANGAGKTTLLRTACGELHPDAGHVEMSGELLDAWPACLQARCRAVVRQQTVLRFAFTAYEVVLMGRMPHRARSSRHADESIATQALDAAGVLHLAERFYPTLSGGEQQRVQLARALAQIWAPQPEGPRYLLLDEPTASLDLAHQHSVLQTARRFARQGVGVLAVLHDLNLTAQYADHIIVLREGRRLAHGPPDLVLNAETIEAAFDIPVRVLDHPEHGGPLIVPTLRVPAGTARTISTTTAFSSHFDVL